jgi:undecaprenyl-diphosphatase
MTPVQAAVLGAIQGLTEFLPVSSSAHLYVVPRLLGWEYGGIAFDVALHWGTLLALLLAFGRDWWRLIRDALAGAPDAKRDAWRTWFQLAAASVPAAVAGLLLEDLAETTLRQLPVQATMLVVFGFLLWWVDRVRPQNDDAPGFGAALWIGLAQAVSLVPGVSRSGVTMTAGRAVGLKRVAAARFSFLLATPITFGAGLLELRKLPADLPHATLLVGTLTAAITGLLAIRLLLRWVTKAGFGAFFLYRVALAAVIVAHVLSHPGSR